MFYTRQYLQSIPELRKESVIDLIFRRISDEVYNNAALEKTSYVFNKSILISYNNNRNCNYPPDPILTLEELMEGFKKKFQNCDLTLLDTGILIDWSKTDS